MSAFLVSKGLSPHKDFWSMYTPLNYYLTSLAYSFLGVSAISARILQNWFFILFLITLYFSSRTLCGRGPGFSLVLTLCASILAGNIFTYAWWNPYACGFISFLFYRFSFNKTKNQVLFLFLSGLTTGLACLGKLNFGSYVAAAILIAIAIETAAGTAAQHLKRALYFLLPLFLCFLVYLVPYGSYAKEVIVQILIFPSKFLEQNRILSLPEGLNRFGTLFAAVFPLLWMGLRSIQVTSRLDRCAVLAFGAAILNVGILFVIGTHYQELLPKFFILTGSALIILHRAFHRTEEPEFALLLIYTFFTNYFLSRIDAPHFTVLIPWAIVLGLFLLQKGEILNGKSLAVGSQYLCGILVLALCASPAFWHLQKILQQPAKDVSDTVEIMKLRTEMGNAGDRELMMSVRNSPLSRLYPESNELDAASFVSKQTEAGDAVYVGLKDHSRVHMSPMRLCWILGRNIGVKYFLLEPGLTTQETIQQLMIRDLESKNVEWMILRENRTSDQDFERRNYRGATVLDSYINQNYESVQEFDGYFIYKRKPRAT